MLSNFTRIVRCKLNSICKGNVNPLYYKPINNCVIPKRQNLNIVSWNINGLFLYYNTDRWNNFINDIDNMFINQNVDVLCLQEVWEHSTLSKLLELCNKNGLYLTTPPLKRKYKMAENTGLVVLSSYPIFYNFYHIYTKSKGTCALSNKGVQYFSIKHPNLGKINFANTHLQSSFDLCFMNYQHVAQKQLMELLENSPFYDTIIAGDLNLETEYMLDILKENVLLKSINGTFTNNKASYISFPPQFKQLDYFLLFNYQNNTTYNFNVTVLQSNNSDHVPLLLTVE